MIIAEIATFTIPKIITAQQNGQNNAIAKEVASTIAAAYQKYQIDNSPVPTTATANDLMPYLNYLALDTSSVIDNLYTGGAVNCTVGSPCYRLHNGAMIWVRGNSFSGTASNNEVEFMVDPDGKVTDGTTNGPGKAVQFELFYNGRITSRAQATSICSSNGCFGALTTADPPWFGW